MSLKYNIDNTTRTSLLKKKLKEKKFLRILEAHNGLSALIANDLSIKAENGKIDEFDGLWESSLTDSASKGMPDIEVVSFDSRLETINQILEVTNKPLIVDGDTGGDANQFEYAVKRLERAGVSMVIIEDKVFPKRNSLQAGSKQELERVEVFAEKIRRGVAIRKNQDFMIVARLESLIAGHSVKEALERAKAFLEAGADGIMIHSKSFDPSDIFEFTEKYYKFPKNLIKDKVLVCVPTTYNTIPVEELAKKGFHIVIHANHLLRASFRAMEETAKKILFYDRSFEVDSDIAPVKQIFEKVGFLEVTKKDKELEKVLQSKIKAIIPAAGENELTRQMQLPISMIKIKGKTILERQLKTLGKANINNVVVVNGYMPEKFTIENVRYIYNKKYNEYHLLHSLFSAEHELKDACIYINGDILFNENILHSLLQTAIDPKADIVLVVDNSFQYHKPTDTKKLDLVRTNKGSDGELDRQLADTLDEQVQYIGKKLDPAVSSYEFIGIAYFSKRGVEILKEVYTKVRKTKGAFQEAKDFQHASFTDIIQDIVDRGYPVRVCKTYKGWMEIHSKEDIKKAEKFL